MPVEPKDIGVLRGGPALVQASDGNHALSPEAAGDRVQVINPAPASFGAIVHSVANGREPTPTDIFRAMQALVEGRATASQAPQAQTEEEQIANEDALIESVVDRMAQGAAKVVLREEDVAASHRPLTDVISRILFDHYTQQAVRDDEVSALREQLQHRRPHATREQILPRVRARTRHHMTAARAAASRMRLMGGA